MDKLIARSPMRFLIRRHTPGTAPGTMPEAVTPEVPSRVRLTEYSVDVLEEAELASPEEIEEAPLADTCWLDIEGHDINLIADLGRRLNVHPLALEDVVNVGQRPKAEDFEESLFVVAQHFFTVDGARDLAHEQISLVIQKGLLMSVRENHSELFEPVRNRIRGGKPRIRGGGAGYLAYALLDTVVDTLFPVLETIGERVEQLESSIFEDPVPADLNELHALKRNLLVLRKSTWPLRDMVNQLVRGEHDLFSEETRVYLRDVADHAALALDIVETYREMVSSLMDLYLSSVSNRMNEIMKVLTIIATIFIPLGFIAGLYGMNFDPTVSPFNMPELGWYWGYPVALLAMAAVAGGLLVFFRRRGWL
jgi:magnesium transporter